MPSDRIGPPSDSWVRLVETSPDLLTALYHLIDEYGLAGVRKTLDAISEDYGHATMADPATEPPSDCPCHICGNDPERMEYCSAWHPEMHPPETTDG